MEFLPITPITECYIKPKNEVQESKQPYYLSPFDLVLLSCHYNQKGLLYAKPNQESFNIHNFLQTLKDSLAQTLVHFYPLAGQLDTLIDKRQHKMLHIWNTWSEIHRRININNNGVEQISISRPLCHKRWIPDGYGFKDLFLPYTTPSEFIYRYSLPRPSFVIYKYQPPQLQERLFHFSSETIAKLKSRSHQEICNSSIKISSFRALTAFIWKSIIRAKGLKRDQTTHCHLVANNRPRLDPPFPEGYFGNALGVLASTTTVAELLNQNLGKTALMLHKRKQYSADRKLAEGIGKPIAVRSGFPNKFDGKVIFYPGYEGGASVDIEICFSCHSMRALECDEEFMPAIN
ncbi:hypothetical protein RDABS01_010696 [Bienertia sinuspersici]